jgi:uncharacterized protein with beta-barrel porin domain
MTPRSLLLACTSALLVLAMTGGRAEAQGGSITTTTSNTHAITFTPITTTTRIDTFTTEIIGRLNGGTVFDQTFNAAFGDPVVQAGVNAARAAITTAGGPGVVIVGPNLVSSTTTLQNSTSTTVFTLNHTETSVTTTVTIGPGTILIGGVAPPCPSITALPSATRPVACPGQTNSFFVAAGTSNVNTNTHSQYFVDEAISTTSTFLTAEVYALIGTTQAIGFAHTSVISGAFDLATRFLRRLGDESDLDDGVLNGSGAPLAFAPAGTMRDDLPPQLLAYAAMPTKAPAAVPAAPATRYLAWAEGYGVWSRTAAQGTIPGDERRAAGVAGGFGYRVTPNLRLGFGVDQGRQSIALDAISESANVDLTQVGAHAAFRSGGFIANAAAIYGFGDVGVSRNLPGITATAAYDVKLWGVLGEAGYRLRYGNWRVVPKVGLDWIRVETSAFTESGAFALTAAGNAADRTRIWGGLEFGQRFNPGPASWLDLSAYGRVVGVVSGQGGPLLPVAFAAAPGVPLTIQGASENDIGFDAGAKAALAITANAVVYAAYDGRFRDGYEAHAASGGIKVRW